MYTAHFVESKFDVFSKEFWTHQLFIYIYILPPRTAFTFIFLALRHTISLQGQLFSRTAFTVPRLCSWNCADRQTDLMDKCGWQRVTALHTASGSPDARLPALRLFKVKEKWTDNNEKKRHVILAKFRETWEQNVCQALSKEHEALMGRCSRQSLISSMSIKAFCLA